jgi:hypothetical protein
MIKNHYKGSIIRSPKKEEKEERILLLRHLTREINNIRVGGRRHSKFEVFY